MKNYLLLVLLVVVFVACTKNNVEPVQIEPIQQVLEGVSFNGDYLIIDETGLESLFTKFNESTPLDLNRWEKNIGFYSMRRFYDELGNEEDSLMTLEEKIANGESDIDIYSLKFSDRIVELGKKVLGKKISYQDGDSPSAPASLMPYLPYINVSGKTEMSDVPHQYYKDRFEISNYETPNGKKSSTKKVFYYKDLRNNINSRVSNSGTDINGNRLLDASVYDGVGFYFNVWTGQMVYYDYVGRKGVSKKKGLFGWHKKKTGTWSAYDNYYINLTNGTTVTKVGNSSQSTQMHTWQVSFYNSQYTGVRVLSSSTGSTKGRISTAWCSVTGLYL